MDFYNFKLAHKEYCKIFNQFFSKIQKKFKNDVLTSEDKLKLNKWLDEYIQQLHYTTLVLSDIETQVCKNQTLDMTIEREQDLEILEKVKSLVSPVALLYLVKLYSDEN